MTLGATIWVTLGAACLIHENAAFLKVQSTKQSPMTFIIVLKEWKEPAMMINKYLVYENET